MENYDFHDYLCIHSGIFSAGTFAYSGGSVWLYSPCSKAQRDGQMCKQTFIVVCTWTSLKHSWSSEAFYNPDKKSWRKSAAARSQTEKKLWGLFTTGDRETFTAIKPAQIWHIIVPFQSKLASV